jgi:hypothetical protein
LSGGHSNESLGLSQIVENFPKPVLLVFFMDYFGNKTTNKRGVTADIVILILTQANRAVIVGISQRDFESARL